MLTPALSSETAFFDPALFAPSLKTAIGDKALDLRRMWALKMAVHETDDEIIDDMQDRHEVVFIVGDTSVKWRVESLASLCRGDALAPSLEKYPKAYIPLFATIEEQVLVYAEIFGDPTDDEMKGVYSNLARLPDGKGHSLLHEHMWQACALALGTRPWSKAQLEAVLRRLQRSCRTFYTHSGSKNYIRTIRQG
ncbi:MAG: hypothetical protein IPK22_18685 [Verrucomicrobiaceae bacterium]|nr:hypothetical protein [Verrucomicrobiaceae bacterium]